MEKVKARSYTLRKETGGWLAQVVITSDGMFSAVSDYGNFCYAWRSTGEDDFRNFLLNINTSYFGSKMYSGIAYVAYGKKFEKSANVFAVEILPTLQKLLREDVVTNPEF